VSPRLSGQPRYVVKVLIPGDQGQSVLLGDGGIPDIVFGYGAALRPQRRFYLSVEPSSGGVARQDGHGSGQFLDPGGISASLAGLPGTVLKPPKTVEDKKTSGHSASRSRTGFSPAKSAITMLVSRSILPGIQVKVFTAFADGS
jgi:hypothetical protein